MAAALGKLSPDQAEAFPATAPPDDSSKSSGDFVWRFSLETSADPAVKDPLVEMVRVFLQDLLSFGYLLSNGQRIQTDSFAFVSDTTQTYCIFSEETRATDVELSCCKTTAP